MRTIDGTTVSDELYTEGLFQKEMGRRMFLGFPEDEKSSGCSNCNGGGAIVLSWAVAGPYTTIPSGGIPMQMDGQWFKTERKSYYCPICNAEDARFVRAALAEDSGLQDNELRFRLNYIDGMEGKDIALREANMLLARAPSTTGFYTFFGDYGVGKSGILKSVVASLTAMGVKSKYVRANDLLTMVRHTYNDKNKDEVAVMDSFSAYQLLAVDEVDRVSMTDWAKATLFAILDNRYNMRDRRATLLATNQFPDSMGGDWEYLMSRMEDGGRIPVGGKSLRGKVEGEQDSLILEE